MKEQVIHKAEAFKGINELAMKGEIVIYGSTYMANFPFYELINKSKLENAVYNRSIEGMTIDEALELLQVCVLDLRPSKVFLHLGEEDFDQHDSIEKYQRLVGRVKEALPDAEIYLICLQNRNAQAFNAMIEALSEQKRLGCIRLPLSAQSGIGVCRRQFKELSYFFRSRSITFSEAFAIAGV